jgi:uncharacterized protein (TIGR02147 family)
MKQERPDIFAYIDYRNFLQDYYDKRKISDPGFTHTYICHRLGQENAKSYFNNVIKGRANVSSTFIDRFIVLLELKSDEAKYFRALVNYNQVASAHEKDFYFDQIIRLNHTPHRIMDINAYLFYKEWYHSAIRAILDLINFTDDYKFLSKKVFPSITVKQAKESVALLRQLDLIATNESGFWKPTDKVISTGNLINDTLVKQFQMKCLDNAKSIIASDSDQSHRTITLTISLSEDAFTQVSEKMQQFKSEIRSIVQKDDKDASKVYHINVNLFPMSK